MALLRTYKCKECNNSVVASSTPYIALMSGLNAQCYCKKCKKIISVFAGENYQVDVTTLDLHCDQCGEKVFVWTPDMNCPLCGGGMKQESGFFLTD